VAAAELAVGEHVGHVLRASAQPQPATRRDFVESLPKFWGERESIRMQAEQIADYAGPGRARIVFRRELPSSVTTTEPPLAGLALRAATPEDVDALMDFWQVAAEDTDRPADDPDAVHALIAHDPDALLLALVHGRIVGCVIAGWDTSTACRRPRPPPARPRSMAAHRRRAAPPGIRRDPDQRRTGGHVAQQIHGSAGFCSASPISSSRSADLVAAGATKQNWPLVIA
jgi:hypothetical protein